MSYIKCQHCKNIKLIDMQIEPLEKFVFIMFNENESNKFDNCPVFGINSNYALKHQELWKQEFENYK